MRKVVGVSVALATVAALAAGCGGGGSGSGSGSSGGLTDVNVGYVAFDDAAVLFLATEKGIFAKHGLKVKLFEAASPTPIVASMVSGQYQFGFVTTPVLINTNLGGQKLKCVSVVDGQVDPNSDSAAFVASAKSGVTNPAQLSGKTIGVVQLSSINLLEAKKIAEDAGAKNEKFVAIPFPQMPQALADGRIQAAVVTSPFLQIALKAGAKPLAYPNSQLFPNGTVYCFGATAKYLSGNAKTAQQFQDAINETTVYAKTHLTEEKATLVKYLKLSAADAQAQEIASNYIPELNVQSISQTQDLMKQQGAIKSTVDPNSLIWTPPSSN
ncbi:ABC transporter substrate-binding protein [Rugosimonospora africana]|uniref:ABC transporter substrate-binding protein n=1 Tax=Rugosimonospora africana TaxID=556532 RepID=UPI00194257B5|nr:ABC transporter substrate-binding protein [Rugosimonospora africana]